MKLSCLLALCLFATSAVAQNQSTPFAREINIAVNVGLIPTDRPFITGELVSRAEMARYTILSLMDEQGLSNYLAGTGGLNSSFADVQTDVTINPPATACPSLTAKPTSGATDVVPSCYWRYIEAMYRRGITKGCSLTDDARRLFCGFRTLTRGEMAVLLIRAKLNNAFPTVLNGCPVPFAPSCGGQPGGDNFGLYVQNNPPLNVTPGTACSAPAGYFSDVCPVTDTIYPYVQKLFELRITNGTKAPNFDTSNRVVTQGTFSPGAALPRNQLIAFVVRAFFY